MVPSLHHGALPAGRRRSDGGPLLLPTVEELQGRSRRGGEDEGFNLDVIFVYNYVWKLHMFVLCLRLILYLDRPIVILHVHSFFLI